MKLVFAGTPAFAAVALRHLLAAGHDILAVLTQPDRPSGRGLKMQASAVKQLALQQQLPLAQPRSLRLDGKYPLDAEAARQLLQQLAPDALVVAAYGLLLPPWLLELPHYGCFNIHASLLPRWRGAAPIQRAIEAGDNQTGITIMQMDAGLDNGDMLLRQALPIWPDDTSASLQDRLAPLGADLMVEALRLLQLGALQPVPQAGLDASYAAKISKAEAVIDWSQDAAIICRRVRAFNPAPGAVTRLDGESLKVWRASVADGDAGSAGLPGQIVALTDSAIVVQAGQSMVQIKELQRPGGKRLAAGDFVRGCTLAVGSVLT